MTVYEYDAANQLKTATSGEAITTYTHDAAGNVIEKQEPVATTYYEYDAPNQLAVAETPGGVVTMTYNAIGQRIRKISTDSSETNYLYDFKKLLQESDDDGTRTYTTTTGGGGTGEYGDLLSEYDDLDAESYFGTFDSQASADAWLNEDQSAIERLRRVML